MAKEEQGGGWAIEEQRKILATIGVTDDASANAYMDKLEQQLEAWGKLKQAFDEETEFRLKALQAEFLAISST